ncbi:hypothetical protein OP10G_0682 [Fimbriimonas ginsengisoli Gsoil 348]|uniref:Uncharacterized protein n=2 Tax=Fimbriimonas ginsengisoli TaxID=1005039 RepID=A0A068NMW1_FIMGI|nr:hypothetical protein OP10G_0682 [Fimbriimonas ginsengisoli Gsoil 348]
METAVRQSRTLHMTCRWYKPTDHEKMMTQREIWRDGSTSRWDEAGGTTAILEHHGMRLIRAGQGQLPAQAVSLCRVPTLEVMLSGIVRINGVAVETEDGVSWHGTNYRALIVRDRGLDGSPLRTIFLLDPESSLPVKGEQQKQVDGRWETEGTLQFEFNQPIKPGIFSPT